MNSELLCQLQICITVKNCCLRGSFQQMVLISLRPLYETFVFFEKMPDFSLLSKNLTAPKHKVNPNKQIAICIFRMRPFISNRHSFVRQLYVVIKFCRTEQRINCLSYFTPLALCVGFFSCYIEPFLLWITSHFKREKVDSDEIC